MILFGIILTSIGIMVFLFAVDAFLDSDIKLFMTILNVILIFALLGVTIRNIIEYWVILIVSTYLSHWLTTFVSILLSHLPWLHPAALYIRNNANLHKRSNLQLSILCTTSLTFIFFAACLLRMQTNTLYSNIKLSIPSDLLVLTSSASGLNEQLLDAFYEEPYTQSLIAGRLYQYKSYSADSQLATFSNLHSTTIIVSILAPSYIDLMYSHCDLKGLSLEIRI